MFKNVSYLLWQMDKSEVELILEERFNRNQIRSAGEFRAELLEVHNEVCGKPGRREFEFVVLPLLVELFGTDYKSAGLEALDVLEEVSWKQ